MFIEDLIILMIDLYKYSSVSFFKSKKMKIVLKVVHKNKEQGTLV